MKREQRRPDFTKFYQGIQSIFGSIKRSEGSFAETDEQTLTCLVEVYFMGFRGEMEDSLPIAEETQSHMATRRASRGDREFR